MIEREDGLVEVGCDAPGCESMTDYGSDDFHEVIAMIIGEGWKLIKKGTGWEHICLECSTMPE